MTRPASEGRAGLGTELLTTWEQVDGLQTEWDGLVRRSRANTIFLTWDWIEAWRRAADRPPSPFVVTVRDEAGVLVGLGPFYRTSLRMLRLLPFRTLRMLGDRHSGAEYPDWILAPEREGEVAAALAGRLKSERRQWHCMWLPNVSGRTGAHARLSAACAAAGLRTQDRPITFSVVSLPETADAYFKALSGNTRSTLRRQQRAVQGLGGVEFRRCQSPDQLTQFLTALFDLNHRRWSSTGLVGTFVRKPRERRFYETFAPRALERGWLRLYALTRNGEFLAAQVGYVYAGEFLQLQEGFDPQAPAGVGNVLRAHVIEDLLAEGVRSYDFLGQHTEHKRRWLGREVTGYDLLIGRPALRNVLLFSLGVWPTGRYLTEPAQRGEA